MSRRWILPAIILVLIFTASLTRVEPGTWAVLRGVAGGRSFILDPGLRFRIPFLQVLYTYPSDLFRLDLRLDAAARNGRPVRLEAHFEGRILRESLAEFSERAGPRNGPTVVEEDLKAFVTRWAADQDPEAIPDNALEIQNRFRAAARSHGFDIRVLTVSRSPDKSSSAGGANSKPAV
jgi:hypothetical protein